MWIATRPDPDRGGSHSPLQRGQSGQTRLAWFVLTMPPSTACAQIIIVVAANAPNAPAGRAGCGTGFASDAAIQPRRSSVENRSSATARCALTTFGSRSFHTVSAPSSAWVM